VSVEFLPNRSTSAEAARAYLERRARLYNTPAPAVVAPPPRKLVVVAPVPLPVKAPEPVPVAVQPQPAPVVADTGNWTDDEVTQLDTLWNVEGKSASECGKVLGKTRNAVIGKVHRLKFPKRRTRKQKVVGWSAAARDAARVRRAALAREKRLAERLQRLETRPAPLPVKSVDDSALVAAWLAKNPPRRFEPGATGDPSMMALWLRARGYQTIYSQAGGLKVTFPDGRKSTMSVQRLVEFVDELRIAEGKEPVVVGNVLPPARFRKADRSNQAVKNL
jgi:hypothetical protein